MSLLASDDDASAAAITSSEIYDFVRLGNEGVSLLADTGDPDVADPYGTDGSTTYNPLRGLKPTYVKRIFANEYSNSRLKVRHGYSGYFKSGKRREPIIAARLVTVNYDDGKGGVQTVTRVAISEWNHSSQCFKPERILQFTVPGLSNIQRYDVDFDFDVVGTDYVGDVALFAITSIRRPDDETLESYEAQQFVSSVRWYLEMDDGYSQRTDVNPVGTFYNLQTQGFATSHPRLVVQDALADYHVDRNPFSACVYYYKTDCSTGETTLNLTAYKHIYRDVVVDDLMVLSVNDTKSQGALSASDFRRGTFEVYSLDRMTYFKAPTNMSRVVIGWTGLDSSLSKPEGLETSTTGAPYSFVRGVTLSANGGTQLRNLGDGIFLPNVASLTRRAVQDADGAPFVYSDDCVQAESKPLYLVTTGLKGNGNNQRIVLGTKPLDGTTSSSRYFSSHDGLWLYSVRVMEQEVDGLSDEARRAVDNGGQVYSNIFKDDSNYGDVGDVTMAGGTVRSYQLMEARWRSDLGRYDEFYPIAQLDFCPDNIDVVDSVSGRRDFIMTSISAIDATDTSTFYALSDDYDFDNAYHVASAYHVAVPGALGLHVLDFRLVSPFAGVGEPVYLDVTLANTGNWFITGFDVDFFGPDDGLICTTSFDDLQNRVQDTDENYKQKLDGEGNPTYAEDGTPLTDKQVSRFDKLGMLAPGTVRTYRIEFTVPEGCTGETEFSLRIKDPRCTSADIRSEYIKDDEYLAIATIAVVDPNLHGFGGGEASGKKRTWSFESVSAPYALKGSDPLPNWMGEADDPTGDDNDAVSAGETQGGQGSNSSQGSTTVSTGDTMAPLASAAALAALGAGAAAVSMRRRMR